jgi:GNAT superfamily N-acetyltransferase
MLEANRAMIQEIEELSFSQWQSLQTILYDGWVIRFANGYTKRANSVTPLYPSSQPAERKIAECEKLFAERNLPAVFKLTSDGDCSALDALLEQRGYSIVEPSSVQMADLADIREPSPSSFVNIEPEASAEWLEAKCRLTDMDDNARRTLPLVVANSFSNKAFASLYDNHRIIACGLGMIERGCIGLYNIVTDKEHRNKGHGEQLLLHLLQWAKHSGAKRSYLQVVANNEPALRLYAKLGFRETYTYWYRVKQVHR